MVRWLRTPTWESVVRPVLSLALILIALPLGAAFAEGHGIKPDSRGMSERQRRAEERSQAAVASICQGCTSRASSRTTNIPKLAPGQIRMRYSMGSTAYATSGILPLVSPAELYGRELNRDLALRAADQMHQIQTQFELNQLRDEIRRHAFFY